MKLTMTLSLTLKLGTRGSPLALWQATHVQQQLQALLPNTAIELVKTLTTGDKLGEISLKDQGGKGLFVKEIEDQLLAGKIDLAVHSVKDIPGHFPAGLGLVAVLPRADARDVWISNVAATVHDLPAGAIIGTSSPRRMAQLKRLRSDLTIVEFRGNVETRLRKVRESVVHATVLAAAGLERLGLQQVARHYFSCDEMIPAIGQGAIGIETRVADVELNTWLKTNLNHHATSVCVQAERALLTAINGNCHTPVAAYATLLENKLQMQACYASDDGQQIVFAQGTELQTQATALGQTLAQHLSEQLA